MNANDFMSINEDLPLDGSNFIVSTTGCDCCATEHYMPKDVYLKLLTDMKKEIDSIIKLVREKELDDEE